MSIALPLARIAVLIDAENIAARWCDALVRWLDVCATARTCAAFGDFSGGRLTGWEDAARRESIETRNQADQLVYTTEKFLAENGEKIP